MIQRIQSVWLLLAALVLSLMFYFDIYKFDTVPATALGIGNDFIAIVLVTLSMVLSLVTLFRYKNRKSQISLSWLNILVCLALQAWLFVAINNAQPDTGAVKGHYWIGTFLPLLTLVLLFMAKAGIRKDEKLVKSLDRLR